MPKYGGFNISKKRRLRPTVGLTEKLTGVKVEDFEMTSKTCMRDQLHANETFTAGQRAVEQVWTRAGQAKFPFLERNRLLLRLYGDQALKPNGG